MGDRRMVKLINIDGEVFYVYSHWEGYKLPKIVETVLNSDKAMGRLVDGPYWTRIMIDQITKSARDSEGGYGIMLSPMGEDQYFSNNPSIIVDVPNNRFTVYPEEIQKKIHSNRE